MSGDLKPDRNSCIDEAKLIEHMKSILAFYDSRVRDDKGGGFNNQLRDDGTVYDAKTKHVVGTCRFIVNYSIAYKMFGLEHYRELCHHGLVSRASYYLIICAHIYVQASVF